MNIWFLQRQSDGRIEQMTERQAYETLHNPNALQRWTVIGVCRGQMYSYNSNAEYACPMGNEAIAYIEAHKSELVPDPKLTSLKSDRERYYSAIDKLMFEDFLDKEDPKVLAGRKRLDAVNKEIEALESVGTKLGEINSRAKEIQIESCRGNIIQPSKKSMYSGDPEAVAMATQFMK